MRTYNKNEIQSPNFGEITIFRNSEDGFLWYKNWSDSIVLLENVQGDVYKTKEDYSIVKKINNLSGIEIQVVPTNDRLLTIRAFEKAVVRGGGGGTGGGLSTVRVSGENPNFPVTPVNTINFLGVEITENPQKTANIQGAYDYVPTSKSAQQHNPDAPNFATGQYSCAEGSNTMAAGESAKSSGKDTTAYGNNSHATNEETHADSYNSSASGYYSRTTNWSEKAHSTGSYQFDDGQDTIIAEVSANPFTATGDLLSFPPAKNLSFISNVIPNEDFALLGIGTGAGVININGVPFGAPVPLLSVSDINTAMDTATASFQYKCEVVNYSPVGFQVKVTARKPNIDNAKVLAYPVQAITMSAFGVTVVNALVNISRSIRPVTVGFNQRMEDHLSEKTEDATPQFLRQGYLGGEGLVLSTDCMWNFKGQLIGVDDDNGDMWSVNFEGVIRNISGTVSLLGSVDYTTPKNDAGAATWNPVLANIVQADNVNKKFQLQVIGEDDKTINWFCVLWIEQLGFQQFNYDAPVVN